MPRVTWSGGVLTRSWPRSPNPSTPASSSSAAGAMVLSTAFSSAASPRRWCGPLRAQCSSVAEAPSTGLGPTWSRATICRTTPSGVPARRDDWPGPWSCRCALFTSAPTGQLLPWAGPGASSTALRGPGADSANGPSRPTVPRGAGRQHPLHLRRGKRQRSDLRRLTRLDRSLGSALQGQCS